MGEHTAFRIDVSDERVDDLRRRLRQARWPGGLPGVGWEYGVPEEHLRQLAGRWLNDFDWRVQEAELNRHPQFLTSIDGQTVHFIHAPSPRADAVPLLLTHGWPSTVAEFTGIIDRLVDPGNADEPAFHVVAPSLPGFGFSGPTTERGWGVERIAQAWVTLMEQLGYDGYVVQGGDFGSLVSLEVARLVPSRVAGVHVNALIDTTDETQFAPGDMTDEERTQMRETLDAWKQRLGYAAIQSTRPQTLAYALNDSPLGLLAWNLEWFVDYDPTVTDQTPVDPNAILTDVSVFWFTGTAGSAARLYKESIRSFEAKPRSGVPTAVAVFPGDRTIRRAVQQSQNLVRWTEFFVGGHFAALQAPELLVGDLRGFVAGLDGPALRRPARFRPALDRPAVVTHAWRTAG
jgi:pimeloyl-ACP methyl ester carboxylesterase